MTSRVNEHDFRVWDCIEEKEETSDPPPPPTQMNAPNMFEEFE